MTDLEARVATLERAVARHEAAAAIRALVVRYMALCDRLDAATPIDELAGLFTADAVWRGKGARYADGFGAHRGREAIAAMFRTYATTPPHFALNAHFLCSERIDVASDATRAEASWVMLQTSTFASGASHLNAAQLSLDLALEGGDWRISCFETENLFSRPVDRWQDAAALPVPSRNPA